MRLKKNADIRRLCDPNSGPLQFSLLALGLKAWHATFSSIQVAFPTKHLFKACYSWCTGKFPIAVAPLHFSPHNKYKALKQLLYLCSQCCPDKDAYKTARSRRSSAVGAQAGAECVCDVWTCGHRQFKCIIWVSSFGCRQEGNFSELDVMNASFLPLNSQLELVVVKETPSL